MIFLVILVSTTGDLYLGSRSLKSDHSQPWQRHWKKEKNHRSLPAVPIFHCSGDIIGTISDHIRCRFAHLSRVVAPSQAIWRKVFCPRIKFEARTIPCHVVISMEHYPNRPILSFYAVPLVVSSLPACSISNLHAHWRRSPRWKWTCTYVGRTAERPQWHARSPAPSSFAPALMPPLLVVM